MMRFAWRGLGGRTVGNIVVMCSKDGKPSLPARHRRPAQAEGGMTGGREEFAWKKRSTRAG
jgi:hypothetical protein